VLADVYYRLQMTDQGLQVLDLWAKHDPTDARIDLYRGQIYVVKAQPELALSCFRRSLEKSTENPQAYSKWAQSSTKGISFCLRRTHSLARFATT